MANFQSDYGRDTATDEFGNPIRRTEDPLHHGTHGMTGTDYGTHGTTTGTGGYGTTGTTGYGTHGTTGTGAATGFAATTAGGHGATTLHRSGSSSSSSSEDDGYGGRRKKGLKEKIKEKLPGGKHKSDDPYGTTATTTPYGCYVHFEPATISVVPPAAVPWENNIYLNASLEYAMASIVILPKHSPRAYMNRLQVYK